MTTIRDFPKLRLGRRPNESLTGHTYGTYGNDNGRIGREREGRTER